MSRIRENNTMTGDDRLAQRRATMIAAGYWRDKTILDHLDRAIERTPEGLRSWRSAPRADRRSV